MRELNTVDGMKNCKNIIALKDKEINELIDIVINEPLREFFSRLSRLNDYTLRDTPLQVTKTLQWKAGTYDIILNYFINRIKLNKKARNVGFLVERARNESHCLRYLERELNALESKRFIVRNRKINKDALEQNISEKRELIVNKVYQLLTGVDKVNANNKKISAEVLYDISENWMTNKIRIRFYMEKIDMQIHTEVNNVDEYVCTIPYHNPIIIEFSFNFYQLTNETSSNCGIYGLLECDKLLFPYISRYHTGQNNWGTVCLDSFQTDILACFRNEMDLPLAATLLLQWSQFYHNTKGNPYNNIQTALLGYPKSIEKLYPTLAPGNGWNCLDRLVDYKFPKRMNNLARIHQIRTEVDEEIASTIKSHCMSIECLHRDNCDAFAMITMYNNKEKEAIIEQFLGNFVSNYGYDLNDRNIEEILVRCDLGYIPKDIVTLWRIMKSFRNIEIIKDITYYYLSRIGLWYNDIKEDDLSENDKLKRDLESFHRGEERRMPF